MGLLYTILFVGIIVGFFYLDAKFLKGSVSTLVRIIMYLVIAARLFWLTFTFG